MSRIRLSAGVVMTIWLMIGCAPLESSNGPDQSNDAPAGRLFRIDCGNAELCEQGIVGLIQPPVSHQEFEFPGRRCLASRLAHDRILTSRFCIEAGLGKSLVDIDKAGLLFITAVGTWHIQGVVQSSDPGRFDYRRPNFLILRVSPQPGRPPQVPSGVLAIAPLGAPRPQNPVAYSVESIWDSETRSYFFQLREEQSCELVSETAFFPFTRQTSGSSFAVADCSVRHGTAGSPVLSEQGQIIGLIHSRVDTASLLGFLANRFPLLIDIGSVYGQHFGLGTWSDCFAWGVCEVAEDPLREISEFPNRGYHFLNGDREKIVDYFKSAFPRPYSHFLWDLKIQLPKDTPDFLEIRMRPRCSLPSLAEFLNGEEKTWSVSLGFGSARLFLNGRFQIAMDEPVYRAENFRFQTGPNQPLRIVDLIDGTEWVREVPECPAGASHWSVVQGEN